MISPTFLANTRQIPSCFPQAAKLPKSYFSQFHSRPIAEPKPLTNRIQIPLLNREYWTMHNLLSPEIHDQFVHFLRDAKPHYNAQFRDILAIFRNTEFTFSDSHCLIGEEKVFSKLGIEGPLVTFVCKEFIQAFAKQMKLTGPHTMNIQFIRYTPEPGKATSQNWHFDLGAAATFAMVFHNDVPCRNPNDKGLDIAFNEEEGPFNALMLSSDQQAKPLQESYASVEYPKNGAIVFPGHEGRIIHRMSTLAAKNFSSANPCVRIAAQIMVKDKLWMEKSAFLPKFADIPSFLRNCPFL